MIMALSPSHVPGSASDILSTTRDGTLQAIAQSPDSVAVYWKSADANRLFVNGVACEPADCHVDPVTGFNRAVVPNLEPGTLYMFSLENGQVVSEKTWRRVPETADFDLLVLGGTASGTAAAVTAARLGMKVALVEETNRLGGMASNGLSSTDIADVARANGFFDDFRRRVMDYYGSGDGRFYEPRVANAIFKDLVYSCSNISVFLKTTAVKPTKNGAKVIGAQVKDLTSGCVGTIRAPVTIDATYTGDFAAACGAKFRVGREPATPGEPHAGLIYFDDASQQILPGSTGEGDCRQQSYAYLMVWKDCGESQAPQTPAPPNYDPENYRYSPEWDQSWNATSGRLPNGKFEINQHPFGIDLPGVNYDYPTALPERRREIAGLCRDRALGYLYFMQNERGHKNLGLADDEFLDSGSFPQELYVREARRFEGDYLFRECDVTNARDFHRADSIAVGDYPMDSHATEDLKDPNRLDKGEGEFWLKSLTPWYQVPIGVVIPRGVDGLLISTAVSATHVGYGTLRMEPVRMSLGQAAGALAYWSILLRVQPRQVRPAWVQDKLLSHYAYLTWNSDVTRETRHFKAINFLGARGFFPDEAFRPDRPITRRETVWALNRLIELEGSPSRLTSADAATADEPITRGEFACMLVEAKQMISEDWGPVNPRSAAYTDVPRESPYYAAVEALRAHRIAAALFDDAEPGKFKPGLPISRADAAEAIYLAHRDYAMN